MTEQGDHVTYRVLVFPRDGAEILLKCSQSGLHFPEVTVPRWERVADNIAYAMKQKWAEEVICLFEPDSSLAAGSSPYMIARHWRACGTPPASLQWTSVGELAANLFNHSEDYRVMHESLAECLAAVADTRRGIFARLGWFEELCGWTGQAIAPRGIHLAGDFRQMNASPTFSLIRLETNGPALWFKAVGEPNQREFPITLQIAKNFPKYSPQLIASRADWNGWLSLEAKGTALAETRELSLWTQAAAALARLQIESMDRARLLLDSGAHDLSLSALGKAVSPFLDVIARLMREQTKIPPPTISDEDLALLAERIHGAVSALDQLGVPDTLGHLDLNPGNLIVGETDGCIFLDWAEAYVGHPFYGFQYLLEHFRRLAGKDPAAEQALTSIYLAPWTQIVSSEALRESMTLAPLLAAFAYAAASDAWRAPERLRDSKLAGYLRSLTRRMNREANQLSERSMPCLS